MTVEEVMDKSKEKDYSSTCPNGHHFSSRETIEEAVEIDVKFNARYYKCGDCSLTWMSGRQQHEWDQEHIKALQAKSKQYKKGLEDIANQGFWSKDTDKKVCLKLLDEYCNIARNALK